MVNSVLYFVTPFQSLVAVEPGTGKNIWTFDHQHAARTSARDRLLAWQSQRSADYFLRHRGWLSDRA